TWYNCIAAWFMFNPSFVSCQINETDIFEEEIISLGLGIGIDYAVIGPKLSVKIADNFHAIATGARSKGKVFGVGGVEVRFPLADKPRVRPYVQATLGNDFIIGFYDASMRERTVRSFISSSL